jgi:hypothetical protein
MALQDLSYGKWGIVAIAAPIGDNLGIGVEHWRTVDGFKTWVRVETNGYHLHVKW